MTRFVRYATGILSALAFYALSEPHFLRVRRFHVEIENLPPEAEGMRVVQMSDFHCSAITSAKMARRAVEMANAQNPDVVVLTGDLVSRENSYAPLLFGSLWAQSPRFYAEEIARELKQLRAPLGVWAVRGNHDASANEEISSAKSVDAHGFGFLDGLLERNGVRVLVNSSTRLRGLALAGLDDLRVGRIDLRQACQEVSPEEAQIILSHNPRVFPLFKTRNALILTGHTHSGQVHLPFSGFRRKPFDMRDSTYNEGWYQEERARMFVSAGIGSVHLPLRFFCPPEIAVFTLKNRLATHADEHRCHHENERHFHHESGN